MLRGIAQRSLALTARLAREAPALRSATFIPRAGVLRKPVRFPVPSTICLNLHSFSTMAENQLQKRIDEINEKFVEAREELEYALEEEGTVYFEEEVELVSSSICVEAHIEILCCVPWWFQMIDFVGGATVVLPIVRS